MLLLLKIDFKQIFAFFYCSKGFTFKAPESDWSILWSPVDLLRGPPGFLGIYAILGELSQNTHTYIHKHIHYVRGSSLMFELKSLFLLKFQWQQIFNV